MIWEKNRWRGCVQEDSASDVPGQEVEQLDLAQDLMQHLAVLGSFLLLRQKCRGYREPNSYLYPDIFYKCAVVIDNLGTGREFKCIR